MLRPGHTATEQELRAFCRERLAPYKVPARVEFRAELPKTMVGKVLRRALKASATAPANGLISMPAVSSAARSRAGELVGARRVAVDADRVGLQIAIDPSIATTVRSFGHLHARVDDCIDVMDDRRRAFCARRANRRARRRDRRTLPRATRSPAARPGLARVLNPGSAEKNQRSSERGDRARRSRRRAAVARRHVVERAVRLDMLQPEPSAVATPATAAI